MKVLKMIFGCLGIVALTFGVVLLLSVLINFVDAPRDAVWISIGNALIDAWRVYWRFAIPIIVIIAGAITAAVYLDN